MTRLNQVKTKTQRKPGKSRRKLCLSLGKQKNLLASTANNWNLTSLATYMASEWLIIDSIHKMTGHKSQ